MIPFIILPFVYILFVAVIYSNVLKRFQLKHSWITFNLLIESGTGLTAGHQLPASVHYKSLVYNSPQVLQLTGLQVIRLEASACSQCSNPVLEVSAYHRVQATDPRAV